MAVSKKSSPSAQHDKEIDALLNRLHSGCRFVDFEDTGSRVKGSDSASRDVCNQLRNTSPPDEAHAELGRALAHSYVESLQCFISESLHSSPNNDGNDVQKETAVERGERIIQSLCCGEDNAVKSGSGRGSTISHYFGRAYASVGCAFFGRLQSFFSSSDTRNGDDTVKTFIQSQWHNWCIQCEEFAFQSEEGDVPSSEYNGGGIQHVLNACLKSYVTAGCECASVYESLTHHSSRKYLIRTCVAHAVCLSSQKNGEGLFVNGLVVNLSLLFRSCVLSGASKMTKETCHQHVERQLILQELLRGCSALLQRAMAINGVNNDESNALISQIANMVQYLTTSLTTYLNQSIRASFSKVANDGQQGEGAQTAEVFELGYNWFRGVCDLMTSLVSMKNNNIATNALSVSIEEIATTILPQFTSSSTATFDMAPIYSSLVLCINSLPSDKLLPMVNPTVVLRLGSLALNLHDGAEVKLMVDLIHGILECLDGTSDGDCSKILIGGISAALGCVFRCRPTCLDSAVRLNKLGESILRGTACEKQEQEQKDESGVHLMDMITYSFHGKDFQALIDIISASISDTGSSVPSDCWERRPLSMTDQCSGLLFSLSLLHMSIISPRTTMETNHALDFLRSFLECYPRLASRALPSIIDVARTCLSLQSSMTGTLLGSIEFLSAPCIVSDPHGAHLSWSFLSSLVKDRVPSAIRSAVIRRLPEMCSSNKRLFRRASMVIGKSMVAQDPIIRVSATAALADLANLDLLRDVEQILGWVQNRLTDDEPAVVHYALEVLRYLVMNDELEFDLVCRVLEKRLDVDLSDLDNVLGLNTLTLEGLVSLMGEGGLEEEESDGEYNDEEVGEPIVSPQTIKAVSSLVELALSPRLSIKDGVGQEQDAAFTSNVRIQRRIYNSLAGYSSAVLGLDSESIRSWDGTDSPAKDSKEMDPEIKRFLCIKEIVMSGLESAAELFAKASTVSKDAEMEKAATEILKSANELGKTLLQFEGDVHGSFLFRGGQSSSRGPSEKSSKGKDETRRVSKSVLSSLPAASSIQEMFDSDPRSASATALLYSIDSFESNSGTPLQTDDILMQVSECFGDIVNESLDPAFHAIQICSMIHAMNAVWKSVQGADESIKEELLDKVASQTEEWAETYGEYAYVAMAALVLAVDDSALCWTSMTKIQNTILEGADNFLFESEDTKLLSLGMVAARLSRTADSRVTGWVDLIEQSLSENSRQICFGAIYALSIVVTNLMVGNIKGTDPSDTWRRQQAQRIVCIFLAAFNTCLSQENDAVHSLVSSTQSSQATNDLAQLCSDLDCLSTQDGYVQKMRAIMIGLGHALPVLSAISSDLLKYALMVVEKLPWGSGKGFVLYAAYKSGLESRTLEHDDLSEAIATASCHVQDSSSGVGDAMLALSSLCRLSSGKFQQELDVVVPTCQKILLERGSNIGGDDKLMSMLAMLSAIGELPGIAAVTPTIHTAVRKSFVADIVKMLGEMASNEAEELKYRDASTIGLGVLCAMSSSIRNQAQARKKNVGNKFDSIQAKDGSTMQGILQEVEKAYSLLSTIPSSDDTKRIVVVNKLCVLFSMLEPMAMPGSFSRVIELTLKDSLSNEGALKASSVKLLSSQLGEGRRRVGFDGRGFVDLSTRLARMPSKELQSLVGSDAIPIMMKSLPNLIYQIPTSVGEEVATCLWAICRADFKVSLSSQSITEFLVGFKSILVSVNEKEGRAASKKSISPALLRMLQRFIVTEVFSNLCTDAVPSDQNSTENVWATYLQCLGLVPSETVAEADGPSRDITHANVFGVAICASSPKSRRKVESYIARQEIGGMPMANLRNLLLPILTVATQARNSEEMKESILGLFEVMLVTGIDTMSLHLMAAKIAFWWDSRDVYQLQYVDIPAQRVSKMSSFFVTRNLNFRVHNLPSELLIKLFDSFISDLPSKLAVLCNMWKISDDVSNRASRIFRASLQKEGNGRERLLSSCVRDIVTSINGGEM